VGGNNNNEQEEEEDRDNDNEQEAETMTKTTSRRLRWRRGNSVAKSRDNEQTDEGGRGGNESRAAWLCSFHFLL
jgi:hypothetical protein